MSTLLVIVLEILVFAAIIAAVAGAGLATTAGWIHLGDAVRNRRQRDDL